MRTSLAVHRSSTHLRDKAGRGATRLQLRITSGFVYCSSFQVRHQKHEPHLAHSSPPAPRRWDQRYCMCHTWDPTAGSRTWISMCVTELGSAGCPLCLARYSRLILVINTDAGVHITLTTQRPVITRTVTLFMLSSVMHPPQVALRVLSTYCWYRPSSLPPSPAVER